MYFALGDQYLSSDIECNIFFTEVEKDYEEATVFPALDDRIPLALTMIKSCNRNSSRYIVFMLSNMRTDKKEKRGDFCMIAIFIA